MTRVTERTALLPKDDDTNRTWTFHGTGHRRAMVLALVVGLSVLVAIVSTVQYTASPFAVGLSVYPEEFDVIVVGGGPAGSVVSKLLSDDPTRRVLLVEAGDTTQVDLGGMQRIDSPLNIKNLTIFDIPFYWTSVANIPSLHWDYPDVKVAKALGGCGIHNAMLYIRALPNDLRRWNMKTWTWEKALEIYVGMESFDGPNASYHGTNGIVRTSPPSTPDPLSVQFVQACEEVGIPRTEDFNAPDGRYGVGYYQFNTRDGVRDSAARQFLGPILKQQRQNFKLLLNTTVLKININDAFSATGVNVEREDGTQQTIRVSPKGQVVVTAGAITTPTLLMLSGLGHEHELKKLGIPVKKHLPRVGLNLQDHPVLAMSFESPTASAVDLELELNNYLRATHNKFTDVSRYGLMGSSGISAGAFLIPPGATSPEIQLTFFPRKSEPHVANTSDLNHDLHILISIALLHPSSRHRVVLTTEDHKTYTPRIVSEVHKHETKRQRKHLEHVRPDDAHKVAWAVKVVREIVATLARKGIVGKEIVPGPSVTTDAEILRWVPTAVFRNSHFVGSAGMGTSPENGVVDHHLRVFGIPNLRVADASAIPMVPNGNVHSTVLMVASHAAELITMDEDEVKEH